MFSKKIDFTDDIQYKLGERIEDLKPEDYRTANNLVEFFEIINQKSKWKYLHFLNTYYLIKQKIEDITKHKVNSNSNLNNILNHTQKDELETLLLQNNIKPIERKRPDSIHNLIFLLLPVLVLAPMLISTYLITAKGYTGWIYLSGLVGLIISVIFIKLTKGLKKQMSPKSLLEYAKSTYVVRHKTLINKAHTKAQLTQFICDELEVVFNTKFEGDTIIPDN